MLSTKHNLQKDIRKPVEAYKYQTYQTDSHFFHIAYTLFTTILSIIHETETISLKLDCYQASTGWCNVNTFKVSTK